MDQFSHKVKVQIIFWASESETFIWIIVLKGSNLLSSLPSVFMHKLMRVYVYYEFVRVDHAEVFIIFNGLWNNFFNE